MTLPDDLAIATAIVQLSAAKSLDEISAGAGALAAGMGLARFTIIELRRGIVSRVLQNAPAGLIDEAAEAVTTDPLVARARSSPRPFVWQASAGSWREQNGAAGYRSGVAAACQNAERSGCIAVLSSEDEAVPDQDAAMLMTYALSAAVCMAGVLEGLAPDACPLSQRELDCLLHTLAGQSAKETSRALGVGPRTVEQYLARARERLQTTSSHAAAIIALRCGWLDLQQALELSGLVATPGPREIGGIVRIDDTEQGQEELQHCGLQ